MANYPKDLLEYDRQFSVYPIKPALISNYKLSYPIELSYPIIIARVYCDIIPRCTWEQKELSSSQVPWFYWFAHVILGLVNVTEHQRVRKINNVLMLKVADSTAVYPTYLFGANVELFDEPAERCLDDFEQLSEFVIERNSPGSSRGSLIRRRRGSSWKEYC